MKLIRLTSFRQRLFGLHVCDVLTDQQGVWIDPCMSIHTLMLPYPIDVLFLDKACQVLSCRHSLPPNRVAWHWGASSVVELNSGYCRRHADYAVRIHQAAMQSLFTADSHRHCDDNWTRKR